MSVNYSAKLTLTFTLSYTDILIKSFSFWKQQKTSVNTHTPRLSYTNALLQKFLSTLLILPAVAVEYFKANLKC